MNHLEDCQTVRLKFDHPRETWKLVGPAKEPGFYHLISVVLLNESASSAPFRSTFTLCVHRDEFEII
jgi:hypothetical protein